MRLFTDDLFRLTSYYKHSVAYLQVTNHLCNIVMAGCLLPGDADSLTHGTEEGASTAGQVGGVTYHHLHPLNLERGKERKVVYYVRDINQSLHAPLLQSQRWQWLSQ